MSRRLVVRTLALLAVVLLGASPRADVSLTQGHIAGTITFQADFVPTSLVVYAGNPLAEPNRYASQVNAMLQSTQINGSQVTTTWSYDVTVEALLTSHYFLRPIAYLNQNPPFVYERVPFPDFPEAPAPALVVSPGTTTPYDISYTPVIVTGSVSAVDMTNAPLPLRSVYLNAYDATAEVIQPDCVGSINFCLSAPNTNTSLSTYTLYLKPGRSYQLYSQAVSIGEDQLGLGAYNAIEFNDGEVLDATGNAGGDVIVKNYTLVEKSEVTGGLQLNVPGGWQVYNKGVTISGQTTSGKSFFDQFFPAPNNPAPTYIARLFDFVDFSKPMSIAPTFQLSLDGSTGLQFPPQAINVASGQQAVQNFTSDAGVLNGSFSFFPPYRVTNAYPNVQVSSASLATTFGPFTPDAVNGGSYHLLASAGTWGYWRMGWNFNLNDPNYASSYVINNFLNLANPTISGLGDVKTNNFTFNTALLKVYFTAPANGVLSDPQLDATSQDPAQQIYETAHAEGFNQTNVVSGEVRMVLRVSDPNNPVPFLVNPTAIVNGSRVTFGPFTVTPHPGEVITVGVPANIHLSLTSPLAGSSSANCTFQVTGTAGGGAQIAGITVNGVPAGFVASPLPGDPNRVTFDTSAPSAGGSITVVATDVNGNQVTQVVDVVCPNPCSQDHTAPVVSTSVSTPMLWPPNHNLVSVGLQASATDSCTSQPAIGVAVFSNEDDQVSSTGADHFSPDATGVAAGPLRLRAERVGNGPGRVYLIAATGTDALQNSGTGCTAVVVPHDQSASSIAAVNAMAASAVATCNATGHAPAGFVVVGNGPAVGPKK